MRSLSFRFPLLSILEYSETQTPTNPQALLHFSDHDYKNIRARYCQFHNSIGKNQDGTGENKSLGTCCIQVDAIFVGVLPPNEYNYHLFCYLKIHAELL